MIPLAKRSDDRPRPIQAREQRIKRRRQARPAFGHEPRRRRSKFATSRSVNNGSRRSVSIAAQSATRDRRPPTRRQFEKGPNRPVFRLRAIKFRAWRGHRATLSPSRGCWVMEKWRRVGHACFAPARLENGKFRLGMLFRRSPKPMLAKARIGSVIRARRPSFQWPQKGRVPAALLFTWGRKEFGQSFAWLSRCTTTCDHPA